MWKVLLTLALFSLTLAAQQAPPARQFLIRIEPVRADLNFSNVTPEEMPTLQAHAGYLRQLLAEGKLVTAGQAFPKDHLFGILIVEAADAAAAQAILEADPAFKAKVFRGEVFPYRTVFARQPVSKKE